mmetsp:Transcript_30233/g.50804  ORF Transcript_30233/g.50804 Transcript_30233/m.50804 type:complete len:289 (-) Transcript_30233:122-988(-)
MSVKLSSGHSIPVLGYGTGTAWFTGKNESRNDTLVGALADAIKLGCRHIDAAEMYGTEADVGRAIKAAGVPRDQLFITTKVFANAADCRTALKSSLQRMDLSYVDLYLIHAPFFKEKGIPTTLQEVWPIMESLVSEGLTRSIGVSNFRLSDLQSLLSFAKINPAANQIEYHPYLQQVDLISYCLKNHIVIESYSPLAPINLCPGGPVDSLVADLAKKYRRSASQVLLQWNIQKGCVVVTTSRHESRLKEYLQLVREPFALSESEMRAIDEAGAKKPFRKYWPKEFGDV